MMAYDILTLSGLFMLLAVFTFLYLLCKARGCGNGLNK